MFRDLSTLKLCVFSFFLLPSVLFSKPSEPGFTISQSIRNELVYTMQQAVNWLVDQQSSNGTWQVKGVSPYSTTVLVRFALIAMRQPESHDACEIASDWLMRNPIPAGESLSAYTWHLMGDTSLSQKKRHLRREAICQSAKSSLATASPRERERWAIACGDLPAYAAPVPLKPPAWPPAAACSYLDLWETARILNRHFQGTLISGKGERVNWQQDLAARLINSQKRDFSGDGCYWDAQGKLSTIEQTAYALLLILEL